MEWEASGRHGPLVGTERWGPEVEEKVVLRGMGKGMGKGGDREQDYRIRGSAGYLLRPEVSTRFSVFAGADGRTGHRSNVYPLADNWGRYMASTWMGDVRSCGEVD